MLMINLKYEPKYLNIMMGFFQNWQNVTKNFVLQNENTRQSLIFQRCIRSSQKFINISQLFPEQFFLQQYSVTIYDPCLNGFVPIQDVAINNALSSRFFQPNFIFIRYLSKKDSHLQPASEPQVQVQRKDARSKQRTIGQVIQLVKQWRALHLNHLKSGNAGKAVNLKEAADMIGIPKKSLDDYYCQLRLAQSLKFDFEGNRDRKMGVLRNFVKMNNPINGQQKHPKVLKIILQQNEYLLKMRNQSFAQQKQQKSLRLIEEQGQNQGYVSKQNNVKKVGQDGEFDDIMFSRLEQLQGQFYKSFQFSFEEAPIDPFVFMSMQNSLPEQRTGFYFD